MTQLQRLEKDLLAGKRHTQRSMLDQLGIGNHTGRISELRAYYGDDLVTDSLPTAQGTCGLYYLKSRELDLEVIGL